MKITGNDFEKLILFRAAFMESQGILSLGRYGVQARMVHGEPDKNGTPNAPGWMVVPSYPDFEGVIAPFGQQIIIEAKVCSQASYPIYATGKKRPKQIAHMLKREKFGAVCYLLIHFNERVLKTRVEPAQTFAIPVKDGAKLWDEYESGERKSLTRADCEEFGIIVPWDVYSFRASKLSPNLSVLIKD